MMDESLFGPVSSGSSKPLVLSVLASLLDRIVERNERKVLEHRNCRWTKFCSREVPEMNTERFLERIYRYSRCSPSAFVVGYAYVDRFMLCNPSFLLTRFNIHRILITSIMVATKFLDDLHYRNDYYAKLGGLTTAEMNGLEIEFLFMLKFRLQVTVSVFHSYCSHLQREIEVGGGFQIEQTLLRLSAKSRCCQYQHEHEGEDSDRSGSLPCAFSIKKKQKLLGITTAYAGC